MDKKQEKLRKKDEKYLKKYGITYSEVTQNIPKPKKGEVGYIRRFLKYYKPFIWQFAFIIIATLAIVVGSYFTAYFTQSVTDSVIDLNWDSTLTNILILTAILVGTYFVSYLTSISWSFIKSRATEKMRVDMSGRVVNLTSSGYKGISTGNVVSRITNDPNILSQQLQSFWDSLDYIMTNCAFVVYFFLLHWSLGVYMIVVLIVDFILLKLFLRQNKINLRRNRLLSDKQISYVTEFVRGSDDIKGLNLKGPIYSQNKLYSAFRYRSSMNSGYVRMNWGVCRSVLREILLLGYAILGVYLIFNGNITIGAISTLIMYRNAPANLSGSITGLSMSIQEIKISCERMNELYSDSKYPQEHFGKKKLSNYTGSLTFDNVSFKYEDEVVLDRVSFHLDAGKSLGIVGKSGAGKSTILGLVNRLIDCNSGKILLDNVDNKTLTEDALRSNVSLVPQMPYIFNTTIRENLLYAKADATDSEIESALKKAQFYDFVNTLPKGLETMVGEGGVTLSGGQRQRLALARAFLKSSKLIMLDEATSALDNKNQEGVKQVINSMKHECSFVIVAHRLSTIVDCDEIIVLDNHRIVAQGAHNQLMRTCPQYIELYKLEKKQSENK